LGAPSADVSGVTATAPDTSLGAEPVSTTPELTTPAEQPALLGGPTAAPSAAPAAAGPPPFQLGRRPRNVVADRVLSGYRFIILVAVLAAAVYLLRNKTRLPE
jgi:hypothetical protein